MIIHSTGERSKRPNDAPVTSMTRLTKNCSPSVVTKAFSKGGDGDSAAIETPSTIAEFKGDLDGGDRVLIDADSPWDLFLRLRYVFDKPSFTGFRPSKTDSNTILVVESAALTLELAEFQRFPSVVGTEHSACLNEIESELSTGFLGSQSMCIGRNSMLIFGIKCLIRRDNNL